MVRSRPLALVFVVSVSLLAGCESQLTGNLGNLQFRYPADDRVLDFNKPVAVGATLDLSVYDVGAGLPATVVSAAFDDPAVLDVQGFAGNTITIVGVGDGNTLLEVEAETADGEVLPDNVNLNARVPEVLKLGHTCGPFGSREQAYLVDQTVYVPFELEMANGQPVIGAGYYPMDAGSGLALAPEASGQQYAAFDTTAPGTSTLTSQIDTTTLTLRIVPEAALDGVDQPIALVLEDIDVGDTNPFHVLPTAGGLAVCQADAAFEVRSDTPEVCDVRKLAATPEGATDPSQEHEHGWFEIEGRAAGTCTYTVTYPGGTGASAPFTFPIEP